VIIKLAREPGLSGLCGNFNDDSQDDCHECNKQEMAEYVQLVPSSDIPFGFLEGARDGALVREETNAETEDTTADESVEDDYNLVRSNCAADNATLLTVADVACAGVHRQGTVESCVYDICVTGDVDFERDEHTVEILEVVAGNGVVAQEPDEGRCVDQLGRTYPSLSHLHMNTKQECRALLQEVGNIAGVEGVQLGPNRTCEIIFDAGSNATQYLVHQQVVKGSRMWGATHPGTGTELVGSASKESGWQCWAEL